MERVKYKIEITPQRALDKLQTLCSRAEKSSADAVRLMQKWGVADEKIGEILSRLISEKYIDDRRFTAAYVRDKAKFSTWGARKIADTLIMRGIDRDMVREVIAEQVSVQDLKEKLELALRKKYEEVQRKEDNPYKIKDKLFRHAISRGYSYDDIMLVIDKIIVVG
ncbi:MAG: regulatory protein RecX [Rikenellaceae bacterium]